MNFRLISYYTLTPLLKYQPRIAQDAPVPRYNRKSSILWNEITGLSFQFGIYLAFHALVVGAVPNLDPELTFMGINEGNLQLPVAEIYRTIASCNLF